MPGSIWYSTVVNASNSKVTRKFYSYAFLRLDSGRDICCGIKSLNSGVSLSLSLQTWIWLDIYDGKFLHLESGQSDNYSYLESTYYELGIFLTLFHFILTVILLITPQSQILKWSFPFRYKCWNKVERTWKICFKIMWRSVGEKVGM